MARHLQVGVLPLCSSCTLCLEVAGYVFWARCSVFSSGIRLLPHLFPFCARPEDGCVAFVCIGFRLFLQKNEVHLRHST